MNGDTARTETQCAVGRDTSNGEHETAFFGTCHEALIAAAPQGATIQAVGFDSVDPFLRAGYRAVDADADVVLARGGEREFDAARRKCNANAKLILCPTHAYPAAATAFYRTTDDAFASIEHGTKPFAAVFDKTDTDRNLASIFGEIVALDLCAFDCLFGARMRGDNADISLIAQTAALVSELTETVAPIAKDRRRAAAALVEAGKKAARLVENNPQLLHCSGAAQMAEAVRMLYSAEERPIAMRGESEMLLCAFVSDFYMKNLESKTIEFPPDNNKRIDSICEYFKTDIRSACVHTSAIFPPLKMRLCEYRRKEFREEFAKKLFDLRRRGAAAWRVFKRLYPDDGYGLKTLIDREDLGLCLALAPDVLTADSMLSFLKQTGRLEKYIV